MEQKLKDIVSKIQILSTQNPEFRKVMQKMFSQAPSANSIQKQVADDIKTIQKALNIKANPSLDFSFVDDICTREQLYVDNLRMESAYIDYQNDETSRYQDFCLNAFCQLENIINYFYVKRYHDILDIVEVVQQNTNKEYYNEKFNGFKASGDERLVSDIAMTHKINAFCNQYLSEEPKIKWTFKDLRQLRNNCFHRCGVTEDKKYGELLKRIECFNAKDGIRTKLGKVVTKVKEELENCNVIHPATNLTQSKKEYDAVLSSKLPSACFVKLQMPTIEVPQSLLSKCKDIAVNSEIRVTMNGEEMIDLKQKN